MHLRWVRWMNERSSYFCPSIGQIVQPDSSPLELDDRWMCPPRQVIIQYAAIHLLLSQMQSFILSLLFKFWNTKHVLSGFSPGGNMWNMWGRTGTLYVTNFYLSSVCANFFIQTTLQCHDKERNKQLTINATIVTCRSSSTSPDVLVNTAVSWWL